MLASNRAKIGCKGHPDAHGLHEGSERHQAEAVTRSVGLSVNPVHVKVDDSTSALQSMTPMSSMKLLSARCEMTIS